MNIRPSTPLWVTLTAALTNMYEAMLEAFDFAQADISDGCDK